MGFSTKHVFKLKISANQENQGEKSYKKWATTDERNYPEVLETHA